jgi:hypothetical protein
VDGPGLAGLTRLALRGPQVNGQVVAGIAASPYLAGLQALDLTGCWRMGYGDLFDLLLPARPKLTGLDLSEVCPSAEVVAAWAARPSIAQLRILRLNGNRLGDFGAWALANSRHLAGLRRLELRDNGITELGATALAESKHLDGLALLDLRFNPIPPAAAERLRARFGTVVRMAG